MVGILSRGWETTQGLLWVVSFMPQRAAEYEFDYKMTDIGVGHLLAIHRHRGVFLYFVQEFRADADFAGRAFQLTKIGERGHYNVLVSKKPFGSRCDCWGFIAYARCKHLLAIENWLLDTKQEIIKGESSSGRSDSGQSVGEESEVRDADQEGARLGEHDGRHEDRPQPRLVYHR